MSAKWPGGLIRKTPPTVTGGYSGTASGMWTLSQVAGYVKTSTWPVAPTVPGAPTIGTATAGNAQATVTFTAPASTGGATITGYTVTSSPGSITGTGASSPIVVTGLSNGTAYTFTVTATNAAGTGPASAASNSVTPAVPINYIEEVLSTWLYTGTGATQTITNGIDLSTKGGLVWAKVRTSGSGNDQHYLYDTARGVSNAIFTALSNAQQTQTGDGVTAFNASGFSVGATRLSGNTYPYVTWAFRKQSKFFDIQTWTGSGANRTISHALGSVPACIIVKRTDTTGDWQVYHRSLANTEYLVLNSTAAKATGATRWNSTTPTSTVFSLGTDATVNASGGTYVAYLFAHDAGGFGLTGTDNVISCGSFTTSAGGTTTVSLGYEPQWVLFKRSDGASSWEINDAMRGNPVDSTIPTNTLRAQSSAAEVTNSSTNSFPTSTGFNFVGAASSTYIYIVIRRGPMKVPTSGTSVFAPVLIAAPSSNQVVTTNFPVDMSWNNAKQSSSYGTFVFDRLRGATKADSEYVRTSSTDSASTTGSSATFSTQSNTSVIDNWWPVVGYPTGGVIYWNFQRAPSFFDEVCWTAGSNSNARITHNLTVAPELILQKQRSGSPVSWNCYSSTLGIDKYIQLNATAGAVTYANSWGSSAPTATDFGIDEPDFVESGATQVAYLFATCAGVSKVGSYTGTGALQTVDCGFTSGARFVLIKRTDSTGGWYAYDSARGITSGNDPYLLLNSMAAEVTGTNYVDTDSTGFKVTAAAPAGLNASGGTYIFLAIA